MFYLFYKKAYRPMQDATLHFSEAEGQAVLLHPSTAMTLIIETNGSDSGKSQYQAAGQ